MCLTFKGVRLQIGFFFAFSVCLLLTCSDSTVIRFAVLFSLLHECGHLACDCLFGQKPREIRLGLFGMTICRADDLHLSYRQEIFSALAGPFVNFTLVCLFLIRYACSPDAFPLQCAAVNLYIFLFNAMPVFSLDGGRALDAFLNARLQDSRKRQRIEMSVSLVCIIAVMGMGFYVFLRSGYNFTLLLVSVYLTITLFLKCGA